MKAPFALRGRAEFARPVGCLFAAFLFVAKAHGQAPDVRVSIDATISYQVQSEGSQSVRQYGFDGRFSLVSLSFTLEPGIRAFVSERLQRIVGDADPDLLDEYYVEDKGLWRVGKQVIPFGSSQMIRESVIGARADSNLLIQGLPIKVDLMDGGVGRERGFDARLGSRVGLSVFVGQHLGIDSSSLTQIRHPQDAPGLGRGYDQGIDVDGARKFGKFEVRGEFLALTRGDTPLDRDMNVGDASFNYIPSKFETYTIGYSWVPSDGHEFFRLGGAIPLVHGVQFEPWVRFRDGGFWDLDLQVRVRL